MADIQGTDGNDEIYGTAEADTINGGAGKDHIRAREGDDVVYGGDGDDRLFGDAGEDQVYGGEGNDLLVGDADNDKLYGGNGNDGFFGGGGNDEIYGEAGNDNMFGDGGDDYISGGEGNDQLHGGSGNDTLDGGSGDNFLEGQAGDDTLIHTYGAGTNIIDGGSGFDTLRLNFDTDEISDAVRGDLATLVAWLDDTANDKSQPLVLEALGVTVTNIEVAEAVVGGETVSIADLITPPVQNTAPVVAAEAAFDTSEDVAVSGQIEATDAEGDVLTYAVAEGPANGVVTVDAATGAFVYTAAENFSGTDTFVVTVQDPSGLEATQHITVSTSAVADRPVLSVTQTIAAVGISQLIGTSRNDRLDARDLPPGVTTTALDIAASLADTDGSETLVITVTGLPAGATLSAGTVEADGSVTLQPNDLDGLTVAVTGAADFTLAVTATTVETSNGDAASATQSINVSVTTGAAENVVIDGMAGNDRLYGSDGAETLLGGAGNDRLYGRDGDDILEGGSGNDRLEGGDGNDVLIGGSGNDRVDGGDGNDTLVSGSGNDRYDGGAGFDTLDFTDAGNGVQVDFGRGQARGDGNDTLRNIEKVVGSDHDDTFTGSSRDEVFVGGAGDDVFRGVGGNDIFTGGEGADRFVWTSSDIGSNSLVGWVLGERAETVDRITDFDATEDQLDFRSVSYVRDADDLILTETDQGTLVSVNRGLLFGTSDIVLLEGVFGLGQSPDADDWFVG